MESLTTQKSNETPASFEVGKVLGTEVIRGILQGAVLAGYSPEGLLKKAGLVAKLYRDPNAMIDGVQFQQIISTLVAEMDDLFIGFMEQPSKLAMGEILSNECSRCETLGDIMGAMVQFREAVRNDISFERVIDTKRNEFTWGIHYQLRKGVDTHLFYWQRLIGLYRFFCWQVGTRIKLKRVAFTSPRPQSWLDYTIFNCEVQFNQPVNVLSFDRKYLRFPVNGTISKHCAPDWFAMPTQDQSWGKQVEHVVASLQQQGIWSPTIARVAEKLSLSPRTLRRQLTREAETFLDIKNRVRRDLSIKLLLSTDMQIARIAAAVGFAETSGFTRAFINWTKSTPSAYRARHANPSLTNCS